MHNPRKIVTGPLPVSMQQDLDHDLRLGNPLLWHEAVSRCAKKHGLCEEALHACLDSNIGFGEHVNTGIATSNDPKGHRIGTDQVILVEAQASCRKSFLISYTDSFLTASEFADEGLRTREFYVADATVRGVRMMLHLSCIKALGKSTIWNLVHWKQTSGNS